MEKKQFLAELRKILRSKGFAEDSVDRELESVSGYFDEEGADDIDIAPAEMAEEIAAMMNDDLSSQAAAEAESSESPEKEAPASGGDKAAGVSSSGSDIDPGVLASYGFAAAGAAQSVKDGGDGEGPKSLGDEIAGLFDSIEKTGDNKKPLAPAADDGAAESVPSADIGGSGEAAADAPEGDAVGDAGDGFAGAAVITPAISEMLKSMHAPGDPFSDRDKPAAGTETGSRPAPQPEPDVRIAGGREDEDAKETESPSGDPDSRDPDYTDDNDTAVENYDDYDIDDYRKGGKKSADGSGILSSVFGFGKKKKQPEEAGDIKVRDQKQVKNQKKAAAPEELNDAGYDDGIGEEFESTPGKNAAFSIGLIIALPFIILLSLVMVVLYLVFWLALALLMILAVAALIAFVAVGVFVALTGIVYGVIMLIKGNTPVGLFEIGLGITVGAVVLFAGILVYNFAIRLIPFGMKMLSKLLAFGFRKGKEGISAMKKLLARS
ncbi:MAG: hypothetical protein II534_05415 [Clostridia bacterium]|nr:hypothetical protein [Clostridia bacterium]